MTNKRIAAIVAAVLTTALILTPSWLVEDAGAGSLTAPPFNSPSTGLRTRLRTPLQQSGAPMLINYQGELTGAATGDPVSDGDYSITFTIYNADTDGANLWSETQTVSVEDGLFSVLLGSQTALTAEVFNGDPRWVGVKVESDAEMTPRQRIVSVAYAIQAEHAASAPWSGLTGVPSGFADGVDDDTTYTSGTGLALSGDEFSLVATYRLPQTCSNGQIAEWNDSAWVCGDDDVGPGGGDFWSLTGNAGTTPGTNFLGTTDDQALELRVNSARALRLEPNATSPNLIGGYSGNSVTAGVVGGTIGGGGESSATNRVTDNYGTVGGGYNNQAGDNAGTTDDKPYATVGGGQNNTAGYVATVGGGWSNTASGERATVGGGFNNEASGNSATVGGGEHINVTGQAATVAGGSHITVTGDYASVSGGEHNTASGDWATIGGGDWNIGSGGDATIGGGWDNIASGDGTTVGGGGENTASGFLNTISGGGANTASDYAATVGGGIWNIAVYSYTTVGGGYSNEASGNSATVNGGRGNEASGGWATVGGGRYNQATADYATIAGGGSDSSATGNRVTDEYGTVGGGYNNQAGDDAGTTDDKPYATIGGGQNNTASGKRATVGGGYNNTASGTEATVGGGDNNTASVDRATVGGGTGNTASNWDATVAGGSTNTASGYIATVGGGAHNIASNDSATVGGGWNNTASGSRATVGGGRDNAAGGEDATVGGGHHNAASGTRATVGGGGENTASGWEATVSGGYGNTASDPYNTVSGGISNTASGGWGANVSGGDHNTASSWNAAVGGGSWNIASGVDATVPGGDNNTAQGNCSFAAGHQAKANNQGCFVWGDKSTDSSVTCDVDNRWVARASGGVYFYTNSSLTSGMYLSAGGSAWNAVSDRERKENFDPVDAQELLARLAENPITTWNYKAQDPAIRHIGPMAQDFNALIDGLGGEGEDYINTLDADGVALAAIQGLYQLSQEQATRIEELETENAALQQQMDSLETRVTALEAGSAKSVQAGAFGVQANLLPGAGILLTSLALGLLVRRGSVLRLKEDG